MEMTKTLELGIALLDVVRVMCTNKKFFPLLRPQGTHMDAKLGKQKSIAKFIQDMMTQAKMLLQTDTNSDSKEDSESSKLLNFAEAIGHVGSTIKTQAKAYMKEQERYARLLAAALEQTSEEAADSKEEKQELTTEAKEVLEKKQKATADQQELDDYLVTSQFRTGELVDPSIKLRHIFFNDFTSNQSSDAKRMMRIRQEMATLSTNMPPGIFITFDKQRFDVLRCMIIGAEGTPYANGCFLFDMYIPPSYPQVPPKCKIITTGKGAFRFNPNLYTNGKVCLSLLGTWQGPGWDPQMSTMLQVFLSIQAMIMCADPIANEPGWESKVGTPKGQRYNLSIQHACMLYAMKWHLAEPPYGFEQVVQSHFYLRKEAILKQIDEWKALSEQPCSASMSCNYGSEDVVTAETVDTTVETLKEMLTKLEKPILPEDSDSSDSDSDSD